MSFKNKVQGRRVVDAITEARRKVRKCVASRSGHKYIAVKLGEERAQEALRASARNA